MGPLFALKISHSDGCKSSGNSIKSSVLSSECKHPMVGRPGDPPFYDA